MHKHPTHSQLRFMRSITIRVIVLKLINITENHRKSISLVIAHGAERKKLIGNISEDCTASLLFVLICARDCICDRAMWAVNCSHLLCSCIIYYYWCITYKLHTPHESRLSLSLLTPVLSRHDIKPAEIRPQVFFFNSRRFCMEAIIRRNFKNKQENHEIVLDKCIFARIGVSWP